MKRLFAGVFGITIALAALQMGCGNAVPAVDDTAPAGDEGVSTNDADLPSPELGEDGRPVGWTEDSHGSDADANYAIVFPDNEVKRLDITIASSDWQSMQDNMVALYGEPGSGNGGGGLPAGGGGFGGGDAPPDGGGGAPPGGGETPQQMLDACAGLQEGDSCTVSMGFMSMEGSCTATDEGLVCTPEGMPDDFAGGPDDTQGPAPEDGAGGGMGGGLMSAENPSYVPCFLEFEGSTWWYVGIRYKGQSSLSSTWSSGNGKLPFRLDFDEFEDEHPEIDNQRFFGFKELSLASNFGDLSCLREKVGHDIFRAAGVPAPGTAFYRIYVDFGEGPTYFGLYTMTEIPDDPMLEAQFGDADGNLYKPTSNWVSFNQDDFDKETHQDEADWSDVEAAIAALHADRSDPAVWRAGLEAVFDVDGFLRWLAVNTVIQNWDSYGSMAQNYYLYGNPEDQGRLCWIPWDNNLAFMADFMSGGGVGMEDWLGVEDQVDQVDQEGAEDMPGGMGGMGRGLSLSLEEVSDNWPLIRYLADDPVYWPVYVEYVRETIEGAFAVEPAQARFQAAHDLIAPYVVGDEGEQAGYTFLSDPQQFDDALDELLQHVVDRQEAALEFLQANE